MKNLLHLIEKGDPGEILSEENLHPKFNELLKYDFVVIKDEKVFLTAKGERAKLEGVEPAIRKEKRKQYLESQKIEGKKQNWFERLHDDSWRKRYINNILLLFLSLIPVLIKFNSQFRERFKRKP